MHPSLKSIVVFLVLGLASSSSVDPVAAFSRVVAVCVFLMLPASSVEFLLGSPVSEGLILLASSLESIVRFWVGFFFC